ncbi:uncharacterized protein LOC128171885 [Crassostrea angulata]|uniref:uncharacterized protein LOC128170538 n=1 Tax=Magallana angulata TaxID=2784310 RepID=UPI0022B0B23F|nr:uncharacterized protein LOC128170538 [Crassostrea angulata]XP_052693619.1 uncharacterized protein LOC128171885 [Crassostrea angulata]
MATSSKRLKTDEGPSPLTLFIMEDLLVRRYANGGMFGTGFALSSASSFKTVISIVVNEKHLQTIREGMSFILLKFATLQDGTVKIGQNTVVMHTKRPSTMDENVVRKFTNPPMVDELGRIASLDNKMRVSVKGEVSNVSGIIETNETKRKIVTLSDGNATVDVKLWGELASLRIFSGSVVEISCVHVDLYQGRRSLNSSASTKVKNIDVEDEFSGVIDGVSFDESNTSILINDEMLSCSTEQLSDIFPGGVFAENKHVKGRKRRSVITVLEEDVVAMVAEDVDKMVAVVGEDKLPEDELLGEDKEEKDIDNEAEVVTEDIDNLLFK